MLNPTRPRSSLQWLAALVLALGMEAAFLRLAWLANLELHVIATIVIGLGAGAVYFVALYFFEHSADTRRAFWLILIASVLFRLTLAPFRPTLSDDIFRYRFDGQVQALGFNPYLVRPNVRQFAALAVHSIRSIPGQGIRSIYPPLSELVFREAWRLFPRPAAFKIPFLLADLLVVFLLAWAARQGRIRNYQLAIYAWNPLVIVEFASSGHNDPLALAATLAATLLIIGPRKALSTLLLAAGILAKAFPVMLVPLWLVRLEWPKKGWAAVLAACGLAAACWWPYRSATFALMSTLHRYQSSFLNNNASIFTVLQDITHSNSLPLGLGIGVVAGLSLWVAAKRLDPARAAILLFGAILLVSPNAYPWYFTWVIPFLALVGQSRYLAPWLLLTILQFLSNEVLIGYRILGVWHFSPLFLWLTYAPFYVWLLWNAFTASPPSARPFGKVIPASAVPSAPTELEKDLPA
jgi:hypothetical protein